MADKINASNGVARTVTLVVGFAAIIGPMFQMISSQAKELAAIKEKMADDDRREIQDHVQFARLDERTGALGSRYDNHEGMPSHPGAAGDLVGLATESTRVNQQFTHLKSIVDAVKDAMKVDELNLQREMRLLDDASEARRGRMQQELENLDEKLQNEIFALREYLELKIDKEMRSGAEIR